MFSCELGEVFKCTCFYRTPKVAVSELRNSYLQCRYFIPMQGACKAEGQVHSSNPPVVTIVISVINIDFNIEIVVINFRGSYPR